MAVTGLPPSWLITHETLTLPKLAASGLHTTVGTKVENTISKCPWTTQPHVLTIRGCAKDHHVTGIAHSFCGPYDADSIHCNGIIEATQ